MIRSQFRQEQLLPSNNHYQYFPFEFFLQTQKELGFSAVDLVAMPPHVWISDHDCEDLTKLRDLIEQTGMRTAVLSPERATLRFTLNATDLERRVRSMQYYKNCLSAAQKLGATILSISMSGAYWDEAPVQANERIADILRELCDEAECVGVMLALETSPACNETVLNTLQELKTLLQEVNHPMLKATLDIVAISEARETIPQWFEALGEEIVYVRLSDGRIGTSHYALGTGVYPIDRYLTELSEQGYEGYIGLKADLAEYSQEPVQTDIHNLQSLRPYLHDANVDGEGMSYAIH